MWQVGCIHRHVRVRRVTHVIDCVINAFVSHCSVVFPAHDSQRAEKAISVAGNWREDISMFPVRHWRPNTLFPRRVVLDLLASQLRPGCSFGFVRISVFVSREIRIWAFDIFGNSEIVRELGDAFPRARELECPFAVPAVLLTNVAEPPPLPLAAEVRGFLAEPISLRPFLLHATVRSDFPTFVVSL